MGRFEFVIVLVLFGDQIELGHAFDLVRDQIRVQPPSDEGRLRAGLQRLIDAAGPTA